MDTGMLGRGIKPDANVPVTRVPDIIVSALLAASPIGAITF